MGTFITFSYFWLSSGTSNVLQMFFRYFLVRAVVYFCIFSVKPSTVFNESMDMPTYLELTATYTLWANRQFPSWDNEHFPLITFVICFGSFSPFAPAGFRPMKLPFSDLNCWTVSGLVFWPETATNWLLLVRPCAVTWLNRCKGSSHR